MPQYTVSSMAPLPEHHRGELAKLFMDVHCGITGAPRTFVVVHFVHGVPLDDGVSMHVFGNVRKGRTERMNATLESALAQRILSYMSLQESSLRLRLFEVPASWVMEGGEVLPEPGEEALSEWLRRENRI